MNNERRLNMSEEEARKRIRELLNLPKEDLLTQYLFLQQEKQELENQQKDFIKYLEDEFTKIQNDIEKEIDNNVKYFKVEKRQAIAKILNKFKEIIGGKDENNSI